MKDSIRRPHSRRRWIVGAALVALLLLGYVFHPVYLTSIGQALITEDPLEQSDAILVLAGDNRYGDRVNQAVRLFKANYAPLLVLSGTPIGWRTHQADIMRRQATELGIPASQILTIAHDSDSTKEEAAVLVPVLRKQGIHTIILVSSNFHTARAKRIFQTLTEAGELRILASPVREESFDPAGWWTRRRDAKTFAFEAIKTLWYKVFERRIQ